MINNARDLKSGVLLIDFLQIADWIRQRFQLVFVESEPIEESDANWNQTSNQIPYSVRLVNWPIDSGIEVSSLLPRARLSKRAMRIETKEQIECRTRLSLLTGRYSPVLMLVGYRWDRAYQKRAMRIEIKWENECRTMSNLSTGRYSPVRRSGRCCRDRAYQRVVRDVQRACSTKILTLRMTGPPSTARPSPGPFHTASTCPGPSPHTTWSQWEIC